MKGKIAENATINLFSLLTIDIISACIQYWHEEKLLKQAQDDAFFAQKTYFYI